MWGIANDSDEEPTGGLWGLFLPDGDVTWQTRDAKRVCAQCEVREQCLNWAIEHDERFGIWGGMSERERRKYKKMRKEQI